MTDKSPSVVLPDRATVELALRIAERKVQEESPGSYWHGAMAALQRALGLTGTTPIMLRRIAVDLGVE
jgi:hypothetical protein